VLLKLLDKQTTRLSEGWLNAKELAGAAPPPGATPTNWPRGPPCRVCCSISTRPSPRNNHELPGSFLSPHEPERSHAPLVLRTMRVGRNHGAADLLTEQRLCVETISPIR